MKLKFDERLLQQNPALGMSKADARRHEIVQTAIRSIAKKGIHATSIFSIAQDMGVRRSLVTHYFKNIEELIRACVHYVLQAGQQITLTHLAAAIGAEATLEAVVNATFAWMEQFPQFASVAELGIYYASVDSAIAKWARETREHAEERIAAVLEMDPKWKKAGKKRVAERARVIRTFHLGSVVAYMSTGLPISLAEYKKEVVAATLVLSKI